MSRQHGFFSELLCDVHDGCSRDRDGRSRRASRSGAAPSRRARGTRTSIPRSPHRRFKNDRDKRRVIGHRLPPPAGRPIRAGPENTAPSSKNRDWPRRARRIVYCRLLYRSTLCAISALASVAPAHPCGRTHLPEARSFVVRTFAGNFDRHTRENGYPAFSTAYWIPACAGTTEGESPGSVGRSGRSGSTAMASLLVRQLEKGVCRQSVYTTARPNA